MTGTRRAELRQVGFAALDYAAAVRAATELLKLGPGFDDPLLAELSLADVTAPIGPHAYIEVLAPTVPEHPVARWLRRVGGASGWVLAATRTACPRPARGSGGRCAPKGAPPRPSPAQAPAPAAPGRRHRPTKGTTPAG